MAVIPKVQPNVQLRALPTNTTQAVQSKGLGQMGQALGQAAEALDSVDARMQREREKLETAEVLKAESDLSRQLAGLEVKFRSLEGRNAIEKTGDYRALLDKTREATAAQFKDPRLKELFLQRTENRRNSTATFFEQHVAGEGKRLQAEGFKAYEETAQGEAARLWQDSDRFKQTVEAAKTAFAAREAVAGRDPTAAQQNVQKSIQALYLQRMNAALESDDAVAARMVFEESKDGLGDAAEKAEAKVRQMELPAQARAYAAAVFTEAGQDAETARKLADQLPDSDPRKPLVQEEVGKRIRDHDDDMRRKWVGANGWLQNLTNLRFNGVPLSDTRIQTILRDATDPASPYADDARRWYLAELDRARANQDRARSRRNEEQEWADAVLLSAFHAIDNPDDQIDPKKDGSAAQRILWKALPLASDKKRLELMAEQNKVRKLREGGGALDYDKTRTELKEVALASGFDKDTVPALMMKFSDWYGRTVDENSGKPPTVKQLEEFKAREMRLVEIPGFWSDKKVPAYTDPAGETREVPTAEQPTPVREADLRRRSESLQRRVFGSVVADAKAQTEAGARQTPGYAERTKLLDEYGERAAQMMAENPGLSPAEIRKRLAAVPMEAITITGN